MARPPLTMILAAVSSGRSLLAISRCPGRDFRVTHDAQRRAAPWPPRHQNRWCARHDLDGVRALHGGDGVAGIDRARRCRRQPWSRVADLATSSSAATRGHVLAAGGGRNRCGCSRGQRRHHLQLAPPVPWCRAIGVQHLRRRRSGVGLARRPPGRPPARARRRRQRRGDGVKVAPFRVALSCSANDEAG